MSRKEHSYGDGSIQRFSTEERAKVIASIGRLETAWLFEPGRQEDLNQLYRIRRTAQLGFLRAGDLAWLEDNVADLP